MPIVPPGITGATDRRLSRSFFAREAETVARELLGCILAHRLGATELRARIIETEAYVGAHDLACHAARGRTARTEVLFGPAGRAYVYLIYGMHDLLNIVTGPDGDAQAVLLRAAEPISALEGALRGPAKLTQALSVTRALNGHDVCAPDARLWIEAGTLRPGEALAASARIGVDYAGAWKDAPLRFFIAGHPGVSGSRPRIPRNPPRRRAS